MSVNYFLWNSLQRSNVLASQVEQNTVDITTLQGEIGNIPDLTLQVQQNTDDIITLTSSVNTLTENVATLTTGLNDANVSLTALGNEVDGNTQDIETLQNQVSTNTQDIVTLQNQVSTNTGDISTNTTNISTNTTNISTNTTNISTNTSNITAIDIKLQAVPTSVGQQTTNVNYTALPKPSKYVPDESPPIANIVGLPGWRFTKASGGSGGNAKINWYMFNPYYSSTPPFVAPVPAIKRNALKSVWAIVTTTLPISTQGNIYFNIYTYDYLNPPNSPAFFSNRWSYQACPNGLPTTTAIPTLCTNYKYLLYCWDAPKLVSTPASSITITMANGQFPSQTTSQMLKDPLDIYTDLVHVPLGAVSFHTTNTPQPANPLDIFVSGITIESNSGHVNPALDFTVEAFGYNDQKFILTY